MEKEINYYKEAFIYPYHLIIIIALLGIGGISGLFLPILLLIFGIEIIYMTFVPSSKAFQSYVKSIQYELKEKNKKDSLKKLYYTLNSHNRGKYNFIVKLCENIMDNYTKLENKNPSSWALLENSIAKLDSLKESFLTILTTYQNYTEFLKTRSEKDLSDQILQLEKELKSAADKAKRLMEKRLEIQKMRLDRFKKIKLNSEMVREQLKTIEDILLFIQEQSLAVVDPNEINSQLSSVFVDMESAEEAAKEMSEIMDGEYIAISSLKSMY